MKIVTALLSTALVLAPATNLSAAAATDPVFEDLKCFVAVDISHDGMTEEQKNSFMLIAMYYTGKLFGRDPKFDMAKANKKYGKQIEATDLIEEIDRCVTEFSEVGAKLEALGI